MIRPRFLSSLSRKAAPNRAKPARSPRKRAARVQITVANREWSVRIVRHWAARGYGLAYDALRDELRLTVPRRASQAKALQWAMQQETWLAERRDRREPLHIIGDGAVFPYRGTPIEVLWQAERKPRDIALDAGKLQVGGAQDKVGARVEHWLRTTALTLLDEESRAMAEEAGLSIERVAIGDPKSRWGSCSSRKILRYSWRLILAPDYVRRATVAHEVAHLRHMNHSKDFHQLVAKIYGEDVTPARRWLRENGRTLHRYRFKTAPALD